MRYFTYIIKDALGIHARPAGLLVKEAKAFKSEIILESEGKKAEANKLMAVMALGIRQGASVTVTAVGDDEAAAIESFEKLFKDNL